MNEIKSQICLKQVNFLRFAINQSGLKLKSAKNVNELKSFFWVNQIFEKIHQRMCQSNCTVVWFKNSETFMGDDLC